jgi:exopolysaccharide biosynthesis polyprenyl glycosylphosphotransferase
MGGVGRPTTWSFTKKGILGRIRLNDAEDANQSIPWSGIVSVLPDARPAVEIGDVAVELDLSEATQPGPWVADQARPATDPSIVSTAPRTNAFPSWLRAVDALHQAARSPFIVGADLALAIGCGVAVGARLRLAVPFAAGLIFALYIAGRYADRGSLETQGVAWYLGQVAMPLAIATLIGVLIEGWMHHPITHFLETSVAVTAGLFGARCVTWLVIVLSRRRGLGLRRTLVVGDGPSAALVIKKLRSYPEAGLAPVASFGFTEDRAEGGLSLLSAGMRLARIVREQGIREVVLAPEGSDGEEILRCVKTADGLDTNFSILLPLSEVFLHPGLVTQVGGLPLISLGRIAQNRATLPGKRAFDLCLAAVLLLLASPLLALTALSIKLFDKGPILYRQRRVGRDGKIFELVKFRSMVVGAERLVVDLRDRNASSGLLFKVYDDPRITRLGRTIRRWSIDELPQLWNVVRGEMSLVGPRPLALEPEDFGAIENKRHSVPPGITGYWQIAGCNDLTYEEMIKLDLAYIQNRSLLLDVWLLLRTPAALIHRRGPW